MKKIFVITTLVIGTVGLKAQDAHCFQASLTPDIAIHSRTAEIDGLSLDIWGENPQRSLNIGFINGSTGDSAGLSWGLVNYDESYTGVQWAAVNYSGKSFVGWQNGFVNWSQGNFTGFQEGAVNVSEEFTGLQLGWINYSQKLDGVQIGLINVAMNNPWFTALPDKLATGFPFFNWSF
jgi:hypothetical protein